MSRFISRFLFALRIGMFLAAICIIVLWIRSHFVTEAIVSRGWLGPVEKASSEDWICSHRGSIIIGRAYWYVHSMRSGRRVPLIVESRTTRYNAKWRFGRTYAKSANPAMMRDGGPSSLRAGFADFVLRILDPDPPHRTLRLLRWRG